KAFDIRLELRPVLFQLAELRGLLERLREAERIAERLNDDERQSHVWAAMAWSYRQHGDLDEALAAGTRALEIAERREDLEGRLFAASGLVELYWFRGELFGAIELAHKILAVLPPNWVLRNPRGMAIPASIFTRFLMIHSLAGLGSFTEAAVREVET